MTDTETRVIAEEFLNYHPPIPDSLKHLYNNNNYKPDMIAITKTIRKDYGWISSQSEVSLRTKSYNDILVGNGPLVVMPDGEKIHLGTHLHFDDIVIEFEKERKLI